MKVSVLGSGSAGNSIFIQSRDTRVLVDAGFSGRSLAQRLDSIGVDADSIDAIVITHEHSDHTRGAGVFARRHGTPVYITEPTADACKKLFTGGERTVSYSVGSQFGIGPFRFEPFLTVHDAVDPVAVAVLDEETGTRLGVATDLGRPTAQVRYALQNANLLVLEANHDELMLQDSPYPSSVKARIASSHGHLSNHAAAQLACELHHKELWGVVLAHLSGESNRPELAEQVVGSALRKRGFKGRLEVARQDRPTEVFDLVELGLQLGPPQLNLL